MPGSSTSARIKSGLEFLKFREGFFAAAHAENFPIPLAQQGFVTFAGVVFVFDDQDALEFGRFSGHQGLNLPARERKSKPTTIPRCKTLYFGA